MTRHRRGWPLLSRMGRDVHHQGTLRRSTAGLMWAAYAGHAAGMAVALSRKPSMPRSAGPASTIGVAASAAGTAMLVAGAGRFAGADELTGTAVQPLVTSGIYRYSRNPQFLGYGLALTGLALSRRSAPALGLAAVLAASYVAWTPVEEEHLTRTLGDPYTAYQQQTGRWWGHL